VRLEEKFVDISCNMALLMVALMNKFGPFREVSKVVLDEKMGDSEDLEKELKKEYEKEQPSFGTITHS
jgi:hypothetical protein